MTLPFRRRHNDAEASHDRARSLIATGFTDPIEPADATWLEAHLAGCGQCARDAEAYAADRLLLRSMRDRPPEPPRDLWARTAAEIERSQGRRDSAGYQARAPRIGRVPLGVLSGVLVVLVVIGVSLFPHGSLPGPTSSDVANGSQDAEATPIAVTADALAWIQQGPDGTYEFLQANVNEVCADPRDGCAPLNSRSATRLRLDQTPQSILFSPLRDQVAVVTKSSSTSGSDIIVVQVASVVPPSPSPSPTVGPASGPPQTPRPTATPLLATPVPTPSAPSSSPSAAPASGSPEPTGSLEPSSGHAILSGVVVVGDASYSTDGSWLAFSARPADGTSGPDLYTWRVGDAQALAVTTDHHTFFAGWLGNTIIANRIVPGATGPEASGDPDPSAEPSSEPSATPDESTPDPNASPSASSAIVEDHPVAFAIDPVTDAITPLGGTDMWHPTVDPTGQWVVYWAGTLVPDGTATGWTLGTGHLVIDGWLDGTPQASDTPGAGTASAGATADPSASPGVASIGPAGHPVLLTDAPTTDFDAWFDPTGTRLAIWIADTPDPAVGTLRLVVLDPQTRQIDPTSDPLPGVAALRGVSINSGRLAWVTPPGQDGQGSHVQVIAWKGRDFGQVRTIQGDRLLVAR